jgi:hypothetical protein
VLFFPPYYLMNVKFSEKIIEDVMCVDFLNSFCLRHISFQQEFREMSSMYIGVHVKCPLFLVDCNQIYLSRHA